MFKNIEDETLSNIENHIEEQDQIIATLKEACLSAYRALSLDSDMEEDFAPEIKQLQQALNEAE